MVHRYYGRWSTVANVRLLESCGDAEIAMVDTTTVSHNTSSDKEEHWRQLHMVRIPLKTITRSGRKQPRVPIQSDHPVGSERSDEAGSLICYPLYPFCPRVARVYCVFS